MVKKGTPPRIYNESEPVGDITWANPPEPVWVRVHWNYGGWKSEKGYAIAWTKTQVYVYTVARDSRTVSPLWVDAQFVRRP